MNNILISAGILIYTVSLLAVSRVVAQDNELNRSKEYQNEKLLKEELEALPKPFGFQLGSKYETAAQPFDVSEDGIQYYTVIPPTPNSLFRRYLVGVTSGTQRIKQVHARFNSNNKWEIFNNSNLVVSNISDKYGDPENPEGNAKKFLWNKDSYFIILLVNEDHYTLFYMINLHKQWIHDSYDDNRTSTPI